MASFLTTESKSRTKSQEEWVFSALRQSAPRSFLLSFFAISTIKVRTFKNWRALSTQLWCGLSKIRILYIKTYCAFSFAIFFLLAAAPMMALVVGPPPLPLLLLLQTFSLTSPSFFFQPSPDFRLPFLLRLQEPQGH